MSEKPNLEQAGLKGTEAELAKDVLSLAQVLIGAASNNAPPFPHGIGNIELSAAIEPQKVTFSLKITGAAGKVGSTSAVTAMDLAPSSIGIDILNYCISLDTSDDPVMKDCNAFVKKIASKFGVTIGPDLDADGIVDSFTGTPFTKTTMDPATAMSWANDGLVVAGMKKAELDPTYGSYSHGHVAIVHNVEDPNHPGFPMASWGTLGGRGKSNTSIRQSFPAAACNDDAVHFAFAPTS